MGAVDFSEWAAPSLVLEYRGHVYEVKPPTVEAAKKILAAAVRGEVKLGLVQAEVPAELQTILDSIEPEDHPALGAEVYAQMVADGLPQVTIDRMAYYATFYWARGREYADMLAKLLWLPREGTTEGSGDAAPKGSSRRRTGPRTA